MSEIMAQGLVYVVDDDASVRRALTRLVTAAGYEVQAYGSAQDFLANVCVEPVPACVVLDVQLPDLSGLELQSRLDARLPIIFLTGHGDIAMTVGAIKAGATDFLTKPVREDDLLRAIRQAQARSVEVAKTMRELDELRSRVDRLTVREREVMNLIVLGLLNKQVASELGTVEKTVKAHRARVMQKMEAGSLAELVRIADKVATAQALQHSSDARDQLSSGPIMGRRASFEPSFERIRDQGPIPPASTVS
jgi:FixJ family two-component response regulator